MHIPPTAVITPLHSAAKRNIKYFNVPLSKFIYMNYAEIQPAQKPVLLKSINRHLELHELYHEGLQIVSMGILLFGTFHPTWREPSISFLCPILTHTRAHTPSSNSVSHRRVCRSQVRGSIVFAGIDQVSIDLCSVVRSGDGELGIAGDRSKVASDILSVSDWG